jgi:hypothetical protein
MFKKIKNWLDVWYCDSYVMTENSVPKIWVLVSGAEIPSVWQPRMHQCPAILLDCNGTGINKVRD